ncbi:riboflavin kinase [Cubamyces sp. BRFM 1775]|nr:riboflavin kinase [Cubamyces sp. BRFM 1775]
MEDRAAAPVRTESSRPDIAGPETPQEPFPIHLYGAVQRGFGRGSKELGCPTANLPDDSIAPMSSVTQTGVYYGYAQVSREKDGRVVLPEEDGRVLPMVMSLGRNPFYKNEKMTAEIHIMHDFKADFYGHDMKAVVLGYIRPELDYTTREALIEDIETDKRVAITSLARSAYEQYQRDAFFDLNGTSTKL